MHIIWEIMQQRRMLFWVLVGVAMLYPTETLLGGSQDPGSVNLARIRRSLYKIRVTSQEVNAREPWRFGPMKYHSGSGVYIGNNHVLTSAHVVANGRFITLLRDGDSAPQEAYVAFIANDCDLALLSVRDGAYFAGVEPAVLGGVPHLQAAVSAVGFPVGADQLSVTDGIVSRLSYRRYEHSGFSQHLLIQVDSAINPGNSGGPVFLGNEVVGIAFQTFTTQENVGFLVPIPVINRFLRDIHDGRYDGLPDSGIQVSEWQMGNPATAEFHGLSPGRGVKVAHVEKSGFAFGAILPGEILLAVDNRDIGVDGNVEFAGERVDHRVIAGLKQVGERVRYSVLRNGSSQDVDLVITSAGTQPFKGLRYSKHAKYAIIGGLVFVEHSRSLLQTWGNAWGSKVPLLLKYVFFHSEFDPEISANESFVVLASRLPHETNEYVNGVNDGIVTQVDGQPVRSFAHFVQSVEQGTGKFIRFDFLGKGDPVYINREQGRIAQGEIERLYGVPQSIVLDERDDANSGPRSSL